MKVIFQSSSHAFQIPSKRDDAYTAVPVKVVNEFVTVHVKLMPERN
jgi:hypothetical protein